MTNHLRPHTKDHSVGRPADKHTSESAPDVLIAENNEINRIYIENVLGQLGLTFRTVENGLDVVAAYKAARPRIVLMDIAMPLSDGVEATMNIRQLEKRSSQVPVPIIALSANAIPGLRERYLDSGMNDYLLKPYSIEQLVEKLEQWMLPKAGSAGSLPAAPKADMF